jgi:RNA polymerase sigma factor (sigma-70 family)
MLMTLLPRNQHSISDFQLGSYAAVQELCATNYDVLVDFASQLILNNAEAHHIVQETFIKLFLMRDRFNSEADIKAFLYITVRNICSAWFNSKKENQSGEATWYEQSLKATARFEEAVLRNEALSNMQHQLRDLPEPEQTVFKTLFCDRLSIPAAAELLELTPVTVTKHRIRAIHLLRDQLIAVDSFSIPLFIYFVAVFCGNTES